MSAGGNIRPNQSGDCDPCYLLRQQLDALLISLQTTSEPQAIILQGSAAEAFEMKVQRDKLLAAAKFAVNYIADFNGTDTEETRRMLREAQAKLFSAIETADPDYYGKQTKG